MTLAYYNEVDAHAAEWLINLASAKHITPGVIDAQDIRKVQAANVRPYARAHFFAGIGGWDYALQLAGWPNDWPVWTGSCPCQPFSVAGQKRGTADERHLWPEWFRLIRECRPPVIFGEQVDSAKGWLDLVSADLEGLGYAFGAAVLPAACVGAPHGRHRIFFVALGDTSSARLPRRSSERGDDGPPQGGGERLADDGGDCVVADADAPGQREQRRSGLLDGERAPPRHDADGCSSVGWLGHADGKLRRDAGAGPRAEAAPQPKGGQQLRPDGDDAGAPSAVDGMEFPAGEQVGLPRRARGGRTPTGGSGSGSGTEGMGQRVATGGPWDNLAWIPCRDGKWRPVKPGIQPLVAGLPVQLARLRAIEVAGRKEVMAYAERAQPQADPREVLRVVREVFHSWASGEGPAVGVREQLPPAEVLLGFLLCVEATCGGIADAGGVEATRTEVQHWIVRSLRFNGRDGGTPHRWQSAKQHRGQPPDALLALSFLLARYAAAYQQVVSDAHAASGRAGALKGAGNAIVPAVAAAFIRVVLDYLEVKS